MTTVECPWHMWAEDNAVHCQIGGEISYNATMDTHTIIMDVTQARMFVNDMTDIIMKLMAEDC